MKDHVEVGKMVFDASFSSTIPHTFTKSPNCPGNVHISFGYPCGNRFLTEEYVDVTDTIETKLNAFKLSRESDQSGFF